MDKQKAFILWFDQTGIEDVPLVGGKNASLGEMYRFLTPIGVNIPNGFAVTAEAYRYFIEKNNLIDRIREALDGLNTSDVNDLVVRGEKVRHLILDAEIPEELKAPIVEAYQNLCKQYGENTDVAVRSSATAEDLPDASFAGQQETYLNIKGNAMILEAVKKCFASLFTNRALSYRVDKNFDHFSIALSVSIQKMVRSDLATSGVTFTLDTESGFDKVIFITGIYGLGENIVQGRVNPDEYYVFKPALRQGYRSIISKKLGTKELKMIYSSDSKRVKNVPVDIALRNQFCLSDDEVLALARWALAIEDHYSGKRGKSTPMDIEWAKDGVTNELFIVQARPETVHSVRAKDKIEEYKLKGQGKILAKGMSIGSRISTGRVNIISDVKNISSFRKGEVLVTEMTDPDWEPIMKIASAIVTNKGGRTCHAAIIARELGIPCIVGTINATKALKQGSDVTIDCSQGENGYVYDGILDFEKKEISLEHIPETRTKIMLNLGNPEEAFPYSTLPVQGVGLAREEFIIGSYIRVHPLALIHFDSLDDEGLKRQISEITEGYPDKRQFFVDKLASGIATIAAAFHPNKVIVRLSDFKSNEYANLIGGHLFEPKEENPMIGWRGASRYYNSKYREAFALECEALIKVRKELGLSNVMVMVPFCRTVEEGKLVIEEMRKNGLIQHDQGLEIYAMCEIPSNVILAEEFLDVFDGFSIGSNDLTQLTLGLDRDSEIVSSIYDERNLAVKKLISQVIKAAKDRGKYIGICGQAPSDFPDFAEFLVEQGIDTMSLNPDTVMKTLVLVSEKEKKLSK
ncbi:MAG TPA: phosphoenolpyruvate synthase [Candidatus Woesearchaeota archaeon]|nr:phosphoenolpyruvate synthase [Candidatus Woesearchaeota archaeon]